MPHAMHAFGAFAATIFAALPADAEPFIGQFELKTLESEPGRFEFQSQNAWTAGQPRRRIVDAAGGFELDDNAVVRARHALELEAGFTARIKMRVGVEFEQERLDEPASLDEANAFDDLRLTEVGAEIIAVLVPREGDGIGLGVVVEIESAVEGEEGNQLLLGPIVEFRSGRWFAAAVPMVVRADAVDHKWDFAYATQLACAFSPRWSLALEGYGTVERLGSTGRPSQSTQLFGDFDQHRLGPVLYYSHEDIALTIGAGVLAGLNANTADRTLKLSFELEF
jgi:hypothetical protein